jgi:hypothetical protein
MQIKVILEGDNQFPELKGKTDEASLYALTVLPAGMSSGNPSIGIISQMPNGRFVLSQTSLKLFLSAAKAMEARYGHPE